MTASSSPPSPSRPSPACLYIVATPIGHLDDISLRALKVLSSVAVIAAEDTRHSRRLLDAHGIQTRLQSYHEHSEGRRSDMLLELLHAGEDVALISDAGTPLISDPGYVLVREARKAGIAVVPVPGACALTAALCASGLPSDRFTFEGFLPARASARLSALVALEREQRTMIFYEAPHRIVEALQSMVEVFGAGREAVLARELTKTFETFRGAPLGELQAWVAADANQQRGEIVLLVRGFERQAQTLSQEALHTLEVLQRALPLKQAAALAAEISGEKKNALYAHALSRKGEA